MTDVRICDVMCGPLRGLDTEEEEEEKFKIFYILCIFFFFYHLLRICKYL